MKKLLIILFISFLLPSCWLTHSGGSRVITVTIEPLRYFTEQIVGDHFKVVSLVPKGSNPETYEPTPQQMVMLSKSDAFFSLGQIGFEKLWSEQMQTTAPNVRFFKMSAGLDMIFEVDKVVGDYRSTKADIVGADPHIWSSIANARIIAKNILESVIAIDKVNAAFYKLNYEQFIKSLNALEDKVELYMNQADKSFMIYHPALTYFARDYGITQIAFEEEGKEIDPMHIQETISLSKKYNTRIFFLQEEVDQRKALSITKELNLKIVKVNLLAYDWPSEMLKVAKAMAEINKQ